jgi:hypothetical protein
MNQLTDKDMISDLLCSEKELASGYNLRALEAANTSIHQDMVRLLEDEHNAQYSVFGLMNRKGMYQVLMSHPQDVAWVASSVSQMQSQTQTRVQNLQPQYESPTAIASQSSFIQGAQAQAQMESGYTNPGMAKQTQGMFNFSNTKMF